jgi:hypothetical protein
MRKARNDDLDVIEKEQGYSQIQLLVHHENYSDLQRSVENIGNSVIECSKQHFVHHSKPEKQITITSDYILPSKLDYCIR